MVIWTSEVEIDSTRDEDIMLMKGSPNHFWLQHSSAPISYLIYQRRWGNIEQVYGLQKSFCLFLDIFIIH